MVMRKITLLLLILASSLFCGCAGAPLKESIEDFARKDTASLISDLKDKNPQVRSLAAQALENRGPSAIEPLLAALDDSYLQVRINALGALTHIYATQIKDPRILKAIIEEARKNDFWVKLNAVACLEEIKRPEVVEVLIEALKDRREEYDSSIQRRAAEALVKMDSLAVEPLLEALKDKDTSVRYYAANALGKIKDPKAIEPLIALLSDKDTVAFKPPTTYSSNSSSTYYIPPTSWDYLQESKYASQPLPQAMQNRIYDLGQKGMNEQISQAVKGMFGANSIHISVGEQARAALINLGQPVAEPVIPLLKSKDPFVRYGAVYVLGNVKSSLSLMPLEEILDSDSDPDVRKVAAVALSQSEDQRAVKLLQDALAKEKKKEVKEVIEKSLERMQIGLPTVMQGN